MNSILIWLVTVLLGVGAASGAADSSASGEGDSASETAAAPNPVEARQAARAFANRELLAPCGSVDVTRGPGRTRLTPPATGWGCLQDALGRQGAELMTIDLRPHNVTVHTVYRARYDGRLEIWSQRARTLPYRPLSGWRYRDCTPSDDLRRQPCAS